MLQDILKEQSKKAVETYTVKPKKNGGMELAVAAKGMHYPTIFLDSRTLPAIKDWDVDGDYVIVLKVTQRSKSMCMHGKEEVYDASFDVKETAVLETDTKKKLEKKGKSLEKLYQL